MDSSRFCVQHVTLRMNSSRLCVLQCINSTVQMDSPRLHVLQCMCVHNATTLIMLAKYLENGDVFLNFVQHTPANTKKTCPCAHTHTHTHTWKLTDAHTIMPTWKLTQTHTQIRPLENSQVEEGFSSSLQLHTNSIAPSSQTNTKQ